MTSFSVEPPEQRSPEKQHSMSVPDCMYSKDDTLCVWLYVVLQLSRSGKEDSFHSLSNAASHWSCISCNRSKMGIINHVAT